MQSDWHVKFQQKIGNVCLILVYVKQSIDPLPF